MAKQGVVLLAGRTQTTGPDTFGIVIFQAESEVEANEIMSSDPAVQDDVMMAQLYPYSIAVIADSILD